MKRLLLLLIVTLTLTASAQGQSPVVFFTDLTSGPGTGGENNNGTILTIYGRNFGATRGTSTVTVGSGAVASYLIWGGRSKASTSAAQLETISVAIGASAATGTVIVNTSFGPSICEDTKDNCQFTVRAGNIRCVSTTGSNASTGNFPSSCWQTIIKARQTVSPGDIAYIQNGVAQTTPDNFNAAISIEGNTCTSLNPCALVVYPGATATIGTAAMSFGLRTPAIGGVKDFWVIAGFNLIAQDAMDLLNVTGWRVINNDFNCPQGSGQSACMHTDTVTQYRFYGNYTHNVGDQAASIDKFFHWNYFTTNTNHVWMGWNEVDNNPTGSITKGGCRAVQFFSTGGSDQFDLHVHDNLLHNSICDGLNFSTVNPDLGGTVEAYNNVIYHVGTGPDPANGGSDYACIVAGGGITGTGAVQFYNNTMYDCGGRKAADSGVLFAARPLQMWNNISQQLSGEIYLTSSSTASNITGGSNNIWFGASSPPSQTTGNITSDPKFVTPGSNFTLLSGSPALFAGITAHTPTWDFNGQVRGNPPALGAFEPSPMGPLVQSSNTNYFKTPVGKTIVLTGSHTWNTMQDTDGSPAGTTTFQALDYNAYITNLVAWGHNTTILWHKDLPHYCSWTGGGGTDWTMGPWQWQRTGPGNATDGGLKFDLTLLNQPFFDRLRARAITAQQNGIYVIVELFDGLGLTDNRCGTDGYPLTGANNINGVDDGGGSNSMSMGSANSITSIQEAYVKKVIDTVNDLPNVIYEPSEESVNGSRTFWNPFLIDLIHKYEAGGTLTQTGEVFTPKPFQHPVLYATTNINTPNDSGLYSSSAEMVAPATKFSPTSSCGSGSPACKVNVNDSDHSYFGVWTDTQQHQRNYIWQNITNGNGVIFMDPYVINNTGGNRNVCTSPTLGVCTAPVTTAGSYQMIIRNNMGYVNNYLNTKMNLTLDTPQPGLSSTGQVLANNSTTAFEFLIYSINGGTFTVNLSVQSGKRMTCEWLNPSTGAITSCGTYTATSSTAQNFTPPFSGDSILFLKAPSQTSVTSSLSPSNVAFGNQAVGTFSSSSLITLTNTGTGVMNITSITLTGANPTSFSTSFNTCGATLTPSSSCSINVTFNPTSLTSSSANLTFTTNSTTSPDNIPLNGTGALAGFMTGTGIITGIGVVHN